MAAAFGFEIEPRARLKVEEGSDRAAVERLHLAVFQPAGKRALTLGLDHQLVNIAAIPALRVPGIAIGILAWTYLKPLDQHHAGFHVAMRTHECCEAGGHCLGAPRSEEHTYELQSLMRLSYAVFCFKKNKK